MIKSISPSHHDRKLVYFKSAYKVDYLMLLFFLSCESNKVNKGKNTNSRYLVYITCVDEFVLVSSTILSVSIFIIFDDTSVVDYNRCVFALLSLYIRRQCVPMCDARLLLLLLFRCCWYMNAAVLSLCRWTYNRKPHSVSMLTVSILFVQRRAFNEGVRFTKSAFWMNDLDLWYFM